MPPFQQKRTLATHTPDKNGQFRGRVSEYKPIYAKLVIERMAQGFSLTAFAGSIRVSAEAVYSWASKHADFADAVSRARSARVFWLEGKLLKSRKGAETTAAIFALRNAAPFEWKDVKYQEHAHTHAIHMLTDAQLNAIAAGAAETQPFTIEHQPDLGTELGTDPQVEQIPKQDQ